MENIACIGGADIYYIKEDRFKTQNAYVFFCDRLCSEHAYMNALLPSLLERGSANYTSLAAIDRRTQELYGASLSSNVEKVGEIQIISFGLSFLNSKYTSPDDIEEEAYKLLIDMVFDPLTEKTGGKTSFNKTYFKQECANADNFIRSLTNSKQDYANQRCKEKMCGSESYGIYEYGALGDAEMITAESLYDYYISYFLKHMQIKVFVCGPSRPDKLVSILEGIDELKCTDRVDVSGGYLDDTKLLDMYGKDVRYYTDTMDVKQCKLNMTFRTNYDIYKKPIAPILLLNGILGVGTQSKLFQNVREKNSLAYYAYSLVDRYKGILITCCGIDAVNYIKTRDLILQQLEDIRGGRITETELTDTKNAFLNIYFSMKDSANSLIVFYFYQTIFGKGSFYSLNELADMITSVTANDIADACKNIRLDTVYLLTGKENDNE